MSDRKRRNQMNLVMGMFQKVWLKNPDLTFGQLLVAVSNAHGSIDSITDADTMVYLRTLELP